MKPANVLALMICFILSGSGTAGAASDLPEGPDPAPATAPFLVHYQGRFTDVAGAPLGGPVRLTFSIFSRETGGSPLWSETHGEVPLADGIASLLLGSVVTLPGDVFQASGRWLGLSVDGGAEASPRLRITSAPFALEAERLQGKTPADFEPRGTVVSLSVNDGSPPNTGSNRVHWNNLAGVPEGFADGQDIGVAAHGDLTGLEDDDHPRYAEDADLAESGGNGPNEGKNLVHWGNLVGVPSGFADGSDNTGAGVTDHGELTGLADDDHPQYAGGAELDAHETDASAHHGKTVNASELTAGTLNTSRIPLGGITGAHVADGGLTGADIQDGSITSEDLSPGGLTSGDLADAPGFASGWLAEVFVTQGRFTALSQSITCPAAGWVLATATSEVCVEPPSLGGRNVVQFAVATTLDSLDAASVMTRDVFVAAGQRDCTSLVSQNVFPVGAGASTFHVVVDADGNASKSLSRVRLTLLYLPTRY